MQGVEGICDDLAAEHAALDELVASLAEVDWDRPTPAEGWSIRDQISHLWFFDQRASMALTEPQEFEADKARLLSGGHGTDASVEPGRTIAAAELLRCWRRDRTALVSTARGIDPSARVPWYGPAMSARSFITARLMETWAHGQDVVDALGVDRAATDRLRHVAHIGVRARAFSYAVRGLALPPAEVHVELRAPSGDEWTWNDPGALDVVSGDALDFCLVVTQRRHLSDTGLTVVGDAAREWMSIAQAFAGPPGPGRPPLHT